MSEMTDLEAVESLLAAARAGESKVKLDPELEGLVTRALERRDRPTLRAALLALRVVARAHLEDGTTWPPRLVKLLESVRLALEGVA